MPLGRLSQPSALSRSTPLPVASSHSRARNCTTVGFPPPSPDTIFRPSAPAACASRACRLGRTISLHLVDLRAHLVQCLPLAFLLRLDDSAPRLHALGPLRLLRVGEDEHEGPVQLAPARLEARAVLEVLPRGGLELALAREGCTGAPLPENSANLNVTHLKTCDNAIRGRRLSPISRKSPPEARRPSASSQHQQAATVATPAASQPPLRHSCGPLRHSCATRCLDS